jgi:hypothetical protein
VQRLAFLLGSLALPMIFVAGLVDAGVAPAPIRGAFDAQVMSDAAIAQRVDLALAALRSEAPTPTKRRARTAEAR